MAVLADVQDLAQAGSVPHRLDQQSAAVGMEERIGEEAVALR